MSFADQRSFVISLLTRHLYATSEAALGENPSKKQQDIVNDDYDQRNMRHLLARLNDEDISASDFQNLFGFCQALENGNLDRARLHLMRLMTNDVDKCNNWSTTLGSMIKTRPQDVTPESGSLPLHPARVLGLQNVADQRSFVITVLTRRLKETLEEAFGANQNPSEEHLERVVDDAGNIGNLFAKLHGEDISTSAFQRLFRICKALENGNFDKVLLILMQLVLNGDGDECTDWIGTLQSMVKIRENGTSPPTLHTVDTSNVPAHQRRVITTLKKLHHETSEALGGALASPAKKREIEENSRKLGDLFGKLKSVDISKIAAEKLLQLCQALENGDFYTALRVHVKLTANDDGYDECNVWLETLKRMIKILMHNKLLSAKLKSTLPSRSEAMSFSAQRRLIIATLTRLMNERNLDILGDAQASSVQKQEGEDDWRKLEILFAKLNRGDISENALQKLFQLCQALENGDFVTALLVQVQLMANDWNACNYWFSTLKRLIKTRRNIRW